MEQQHRLELQKHYEYQQHQRQCELNEQLKYQIKSDMKQYQPHQQQQSSHHPYDESHFYEEINYLTSTSTQTPKRVQNNQAIKYCDSEVQYSHNYSDPKFVTQTIPMANKHQMNQLSHPSSHSPHQGSSSLAFDYQIADYQIDSNPNHIYPPPKQYQNCDCENCIKRTGANLTTELLPLETQIPLQMMGESALLCTIL